MNKSIEQAANNEVKEISNEENLSNVEKRLIKSTFIAGAKHQKELSDAREKLLLDVIGEVVMKLSENLSDECADLGNIKTKSDRVFYPIISSVAKKLEGL